MEKSDLERLCLLGAITIEVDDSLTVTIKLEDEVVT